MLTLQDAAANQKLAALQTLWEQKRGERAMPCRGDLSVADLRPWLGNLALIDLDGAGDTFRLCGTNLFARFGGDVTGLRVADLRDEGGRSFRDGIARVRTERLPSIASHTQIIHGEEVVFNELALPLSSGGIVPKVVLFASYPATAKWAG
ncbi:MAG: PAS domain-containing protein [Alphaproteobacteria bacterium]|nr:PAS domain-containing protein [Alphaproteobacteria bacterium]MBV9693761.1 PAS domain-containing protein [Alphaproteobacteria bacterium]